ncbi:flagellar assembly protein T N-terminal domain-containing protein [Ferrimonas pelagia]|uniref:Flagellar assembly protein T, C-terminal domain n=1 Tax=Ferrimonas pelagia TaxID=1177826 RepID=A0ABP9F088_9GAMM
MRSTLALLLALLISPSVLALPFEITGQAPVINNDEDDARRRAIDRALSQAIFSQGGMVDFNQSSQNGVLEQEQVSWQSRSQVRSMELLSEHRKGDIYSVELLVELESASDNQCQGLVGRAAITLPRAQVRYREQLVPGGLYELDGAFVRLLANAISGESRNAFASARDDLRLDLLSPQPDWIMSLGEQEGSQYILNLIIDDLSVDRPDKLFGYIERDATRTIAIEARLYDAFSGERVWQQRYRSAAAWEYKRQEMADTATERFWASDFGAELRRLGMDIIADLDGLLTCQPLQGRITRLEHDTAILDLGLRNGVRPGDRLQLVQQRELSGQHWGEASRVTLILEQVRPESARARIQGDGAMTGVQIGDWVERASR